MLSDEWKVSGGLRYNDDDKEQDQNGGSVALQLPDLNNPGQTINVVYGALRGKYFDAACCGYSGTDGRTLVDSKRKTWTEVTWNIGVEYTPTDNLMWYGR